MKKSINILAAFCGLALVAGALLLYPSRRPPDKEPGYPVQRQIQSSFTLQNRGNQALEKAEFWVAAPAKQTATRHIKFFRMRISS